MQKMSLPQTYILPCNKFAFTKVKLINGWKPENHLKLLALKNILFSTIWQWYLNLNINWISYLVTLNLLQKFSLKISLSHPSVIHWRKHYPSFVQQESAVFLSFMVSLCLLSVKQQFDALNSLCTCSVNLACCVFC